MTRRFLIADDHLIVRSTLRVIIAPIFANCIIDDCRNGQDCLEKAGSNRYDMIIADLQMPQTNALQLISRLRKLQPEAKILVFTMLDEWIGAPKFFQMGVDGYLCKDCDVEVIPLVIRKLMANRKHISLPLKDQMLDTGCSRSFRNPFDVLTAAERKVAQWLVEGKDTEELQSRLNLDASAVEEVTISILQKMKLVSTMELKCYADLYL